MKHKEVVLVALALAVSANLFWPAMGEEGLPSQWTVIGSHTEHYEFRKDKDKGTPDQPASMILARNDAGKGDSAAIIQEFDATPFRGKIIGFTPDIQYNGMDRGYEYWIRVYDEKGVIAYNVFAPPNVEGSVEGELMLRQLSNQVTLPIAQEAAHIEIGVGVRNKGELLLKKWSLDNVTIAITGGWNVLGGIATFGPDSLGKEARAKIVNEQKFVFSTLPVNPKWPATATPNWEKNVDTTGNPAKQE